MIYLVEQWNLKIKIRLHISDIVLCKQVLIRFKLKNVHSGVAVDTESVHKISWRKCMLGYKSLLHRKSESSAISIFKLLVDIIFPPFLIQLMWYACWSLVSKIQQAY